MKYDKFIDVEGSFASQLSFLSEAVSDDEARFFMKYIHIEPSDKGDELLGVATDGRHLHLIDPLKKDTAEYFGITQGYWQLLRKYKRQDRVWIARLDDSVTNGWSFPNWHKIVPTGEAVYKTTFKGFSFDERLNHNGLSRLLHEFPEETGINLVYLQSLGTFCEWNVEWFGQNKAIRFIDGDRMALIMPIQMD